MGPSGASSVDEEEDQQRYGSWMELNALRVKVTSCLRGWRRSYQSSQGAEGTLGTGRSFPLLQTVELG